MTLRLFTNEEFCFLKNDSFLLLIVLAHLCASMTYEGCYRGLQKGGRLFKNSDIIPILGFGTGTGYFERPDSVAEGIILAFKAGYRLIDTAQVCPILRLISAFL